MHKFGKILLFAIAILSLSSCLVRHSQYRKWSSKRNRTYTYPGHHSGRKLWVYDPYKNTR